jgi:hypothetical protein
MGQQESTLLFNYHPRFQIWGKDYVRQNLAGCARAEPFKRRKKMSTAKVPSCLDVHNL